ncbi:hypothetical protein J4G37_20985, partial [Microvirga sp. 3-52]|nr:hypothetical protein [Microvirga sp. 3-52]
LVKEQVPHKRHKRTPSTPAIPCQDDQAPKPRKQKDQTTPPPMKLFYPNPFLRSTPISKKFLEIGVPSLLLQYSGKLCRSQKRIRLCVDAIRID